MSNVMETSLLMNVRELLDFKTEVLLPVFDLVVSSLLDIEEARD